MGRTPATRSAMFRLDDFLARRAAHSTLLARARGAFAPLEVREVDGLRWFTAGGRYVQGLMDVAAPARIVLPHHHAMLGALSWASHDARLLNLGLGCGTFERFAAAHLPHASIVSVEPDEAVVSLARAHFAVPADLEVVTTSAADYLARTDARFDLIVCDIFAGEHHPDCLFDSYFHADLAEHLDDDGVLALNLSPRENDEVVAILAALRQSIDWVMLAPVAEHGNIVVLASRAAPPPPGRMRRRAGMLARAWGLAEEALLPGFERLPSRREIVGGFGDEQGEEDEPDFDHDAAAGTASDP